jgi:hypothetical protein
MANTTGLREVPQALDKPSPSGSNSAKQSEFWR